MVVKVKMEPTESSSLLPQSNMHERPHHHKRNAVTRCLATTSLAHAVLCVVLLSAIIVPIVYILRYGFSAEECNSLHYLQSWHPNTNITLPVYSTHPLDTYNSDITNVVILQHGNLRNGGEVFCAGLKSLTSSFLMPRALPRTTLLIATQFYIEGDTCYHNGIGKKMNASETCGFPLYTSEGWKDGLSAINKNLFSYDVFDMLYDRFADEKYFPSVTSVTYFGFSAGGQVVLRHAIYPHYATIHTEAPAPPTPYYIISDPSTYLYFTPERPTLSSGAFGIPNATWLPSQWAVDSGNTSATWINTWSHCEKYNHWRFGLENMAGYYKYHSNHTAGSLQSSIRDYQYRRVTYLMGEDDVCNCKLSITNAICNNHTGNRCSDHDLVTTCSGMLQGENRVLRMLNYVKYLKQYYGRKIKHRLVKVPEVGHDVMAMLASPIGKCEVFDICSETAYANNDREIQEDTLND